MYCIYDVHNVKYWLQDSNFIIDHVSKCNSLRSKYISLTIHVDRVNVLQNTALVQIHPLFPATF